MSVKLLYGVDVMDGLKLQDRMVDHFDLSVERLTVGNNSFAHRSTRRRTATLSRRAFFASSEFQNKNSLSAFDRKIGQEGFKNLGRQLVARLITVKRPLGIFRAGRLFVVIPAEDFLKQLYSRLINHSYLNPLVVLRIYAVKACRAFLNTNITLTINKPGEVGDSCIFHESHIPSNGGLVK